MLDEDEPKGIDPADETTDTYILLARVLRVDFLVCIPHESLHSHD